MYFCNNNSIKNCPNPNGTLLAFDLKTINFNNVSFGFQFFIGYQNTGMWYRSTVNNSQADWIKII